MTPWRINLITPLSRQAPFLEYNPRERRWRIWQSFTPDVSVGTYLDIYPDGHLERTTIQPDGSVSITNLGDAHDHNRE